MTLKSYRVFTSTANNGDPHFVRYCRRVVADTLAQCSRGDDFNELYPFEGNDSIVAYAIWRLAVANFMGEMIGCQGKKRGPKFKHFEYDTLPIDRYIVEHDLTNRKFAEILGISTTIVDGARSGNYNGRRMVQWILSWIEMQEGNRRSA